MAVARMTVDDMTAEETAYWEGCVEEGDRIAAWLENRMHTSTATGVARTVQHNYLNALATLIRNGEHRTAGGEAATK